MILYYYRLSHGKTIETVITRKILAAVRRTKHPV